MFIGLARHVAASCESPTLPEAVLHLGHSGRKAGRHHSAVGWRGLGLCSFGPRVLCGATTVGSLAGARLAQAWPGRLWNEQQVGLDTGLGSSRADLHPMICQWGYGATAARLTPDQKVGSSNLSALTIAVTDRLTTTDTF